MNKIALSDLLRLLFEPRGPFPILFIVGSIALSVLGSAVYELLTRLVGSEPITLIGVAIGAVAIVLFVLAVLRSAMTHLFKSPIMPITVSPEQRAEPHPGLVLPIGLRDDGPEMPIARWHARNGVLRHCWLLASPAAIQSNKYRDLRQWLVEANVVVHQLTIPDVIDARQSYQAVRQAITEARALPGARPLIVDTTSGTKPMTIGTVLACLEQDIAIQILPTSYNATGMPHTEASIRQEPIAITLRPEQPGEQQ